MTVVGVLLAAGAGERFGGPKALARDEDGTSWLVRSVRALGPCAEVVVVLGAQAEAAASLLPNGVTVVRADDWAEGMGASLRAGLAALADTPYDAALVSLSTSPTWGPTWWRGWSPRLRVPATSCERRTTGRRGTRC